MSQNEIPTPVLVLALLAFGPVGAFIVCGAAGWPLWVPIVTSVVIVVTLALCALAILGEGER